MPHPEHCAVLEVLFPGYSARQLFAIAEPPEPASLDEPAAVGRPEMSRDGGPGVSDSAGLVLPGQALASALTELALPADIAARYTSTRLITRVQQARTELQPWQDTNAVRELDDRLTTYGLA
ncbi:MAG: hypothetical protein ACT4NY_30665 [Pseudonocardiales bacterium]